MPCRDDGPPPGYNPTVEKNNALTRFLCYTVNAQRNGFSLEEQMKKDPSFASWIQQHDQEDAERIKKNTQERQERNLKRRALAKLTPEERKALKL